MLPPELAPVMILFRSVSSKQEVVYSSPASAASTTSPARLDQRPAVHGQSLPGAAAWPSGRATDR